MSSSACEKFYTAISEEAFIQAQLLAKSELPFKTFEQCYLSRIHWSTNALQAYDPKSDKVYFSSF